jgi:hypothetical protein
LAAFLIESVIFVLQLFHPVVLRAEILFQCGKLLGEPLHLHFPHLVLMGKGGIFLDQLLIFGLRLLKCLLALTVLSILFLRGRYVCSEVRFEHVVLRGAD